MSNMVKRTESAAVSYFDATLDLLNRLRTTQLGAIQQAAKLCADRIAQGGLIFLFGCGHSRMMCEEMTPRQGCFVGFVALVEQSLSNHSAIVGTNGLRPPLYLEKYEGYAEQILNGFKFGPHDAFIVISTSGIRPVPVEMVEGCTTARVSGDRDCVARSLRTVHASAFFGQETDRLCRYHYRQRMSAGRLRRGVGRTGLAHRPDLDGDRER